MILELTNSVKHRLAEGELLEPRLLANDPSVDGDLSLASNPVVVRTAAEARAVVDSLADAGADFIKVFENLRREAYFAILSLQKEVALEIAHEVRAELTPQEERLLADAKPVVPEAYRQYMRGRYFWNQRRTDAMRQAIEHFERAIEIDPAYALGWAGLADCYVVPSSPFQPATALPRAKAAADRALDLDGDLAEAHTTLGSAVIQYDYDWEVAGRHFRRAIELNPGYATGHQWYAEYLSAVGRMDEAVEEARKAAELDPLSAIILWNLQRVLLFARRYDESIAWGRQLQSLVPYMGLNEFYLSLALRL